MSEKRERTYYRVYEVMIETGDEEYYAEAEGPNALLEAQGYAVDIDTDDSELGRLYKSAIYKVTEIEEKVN